MLTFNKLSSKEQTVLYHKSEIQYNVTHLNTLLHHLFTRVNDSTILNDANVLIEAFINNLNTIIFTPNEGNNKEDTH